MAGFRDRRKAIRDNSQCKRGGGNVCRVLANHPLTGPFIALQNEMTDAAHQRVALNTFSVPYATGGAYGMSSSCWKHFATSNCVVRAGGIRRCDTFETKRNRKKYNVSTCLRALTHRMKMPPWVYACTCTQCDCSIESPGRFAQFQGQGAQCATSCRSQEWHGDGARALADACVRRLVAARH